MVTDTTRQLKARLQSLGPLYTVVMAIVICKYLEIYPDKKFFQ